MISNSGVPLQVTTKRALWIFMISAILHFFFSFSVSRRFKLTGNGWKKNAALLMVPLMCSN